MNRQAISAMAIVVGLVAGAWAQVPARPQDLFLNVVQGEERCSIADSRVSLASSIDTVMLSQSVTGVAPGSVVLSWRRPPKEWRKSYGPSPDTLTVVETTLPDSATLAVRAALLRAIDRSTDSLALLLRVDVGAHPLLRVAHALQCPPALIENDGSYALFQSRMRQIGSRRHRAVPVSALAT